MRPRLIAVDDGTKNTIISYQSSKLQ